MKRTKSNAFHRLATANRFAALLLAALLTGGCVLVEKSDKAAQAVFGAAGGEPVPVPYAWATPGGAGGPPAVENDPEAAP